MIFFLLILLLITLLPCNRNFLPFNISSLLSFYTYNQKKKQFIILEDFILIPHAYQFMFTFDYHLWLVPCQYIRNWIFVIPLILQILLCIYLLNEFFKFKNVRIFHAHEYEFPAALGKLGTLVTLCINCLPVSTVVFVVLVSVIRESRCSLTGPSGSGPLMNLFSRSVRGLLSL